MSSSGESKVVWTCPECSRSFRIPKSKRRPSVCVKCARKAKASGAVQSSGLVDDEELYFQDADASPKSSLKFGIATQAAMPDESVSASPAPSSGSDNGTSIEELSERMDVMLEHLEGITRTMKLVRWVMWGLGGATVLSVVVTLGGLLYSMSMMGSLTDLLNQPADGFGIDELPVEGHGAEGGRVGNGGNHNAQIPPQLREKLKPIQDYSDTLNELLKEVNQ